MEELNLSEQMSINGGGINASMVWYNLYGAFAKHGCAYPVGYKSRPIIIGTTNHPTFGDHWIIGHGYFTSPVDGNYVIVNNGWGNNNVWIEPSTTYLDGTIHFTN